MKTEAGFPGDLVGTAEPLSAKKVAHHYGPSITIRNSILIFKPEVCWKVDDAKITVGGGAMRAMRAGRIIFTQRWRHDPG